MNALKQFDLSYINHKNLILAGVDEAGRGPLAGPVIAASVIFDFQTEIEKVNDSKVLKESDRDFLYQQIMDKAISVTYTVLDNNVIDEINILQASLKAMKLSVEKHQPQPNIILIDGNKKFISNIESHAIIKGDSKSFSIAAASIIAKVERDRLMKELDKEYPQFNWKQNKGYPTKEHIEAVKKFGPTPYHRRTFLRKILNEETQVCLYDKL